MPCSPAVRSGGTRQPADGPLQPTRGGRMPNDGRRRQGRRKEDSMAATAPDATKPGTPGWLDAFLDAWSPGTGGQIEDIEPATGLHLATFNGSTTDDVARAAVAAAAAQPAWADTDYQERARILRRAADI